MAVEDLPDSFEMQCTFRFRATESPSPSQLVKRLILGPLRAHSEEPQEKDGYDHCRVVVGLAPRSNLFLEDRNC
jgi:hypothetical protein